jgi:hypothetical protein
MRGVAAYFAYGRLIGYMIFTSSVRCRDGCLLEHHGENTEDWHHAGLHGLVRVFIDAWGCPKYKVPNDRPSIDRLTFSLKFGRSLFVRLPGLIQGLSQSRRLPYFSAQQMT